MDIIKKDIEQILIQEDIEGLIEAGAPNDEYSDEAAQIFSAMSQLNQAGENNAQIDEVIYPIICLIWSKSFDLDAKDMEHRAPAIKRVVQKILSL
jgi:hypothetical protein